MSLLTIHYSKTAKIGDNELVAIRISYREIEIDTICALCEAIFRTHGLLLSNDKCYSKTQLIQLHFLAHECVFKVELQTETNMVLMKIRNSKDGSRIRI